MKQLYYLGFVDTSCFLETFAGSGVTPEEARRDAEDTAECAAVTIRALHVVGPVHVYRKDEMLPIGARVIYRDVENHELLPQGGHVAVAQAECTMHSILVPKTDGNGRRQSDNSYHI